jgi:hypothetical protein
VCTWGKKEIAAVPHRLIERFRIEHPPGKAPPESYLERGLDSLLGVD